ncbi:unnamed protein product [Ceutorhynchus assimilis]|uniref:Uncharacterized protein n=1 Tax=Ceutorhynchus assimilis TaxID=467358 RepID=A0A9N9MRP6_9CUCU|nr:unnamed protein product [Ceutorhynchus assimilis]
MSKKAHKTKKLSKISQETHSQSTEDHEILSKVIDDYEGDERTIIITVNSFKNIKPTYPISDIKVHLKYLNQDLGESRPVRVVSDEKLPLEVGDSVELLIDIDSMKQLDLLASNPVFITAFQLTGAVEPDMYSYLQKSEEESKVSLCDIDSLFSMYEMCEEREPQEKPKVQLPHTKTKKKGKR